MLKRRFSGSVVRPGSAALFGAVLIACSSALAGGPIRWRGLDDPVLVAKSPEQLRVVLQEIASLGRQPEEGLHSVRAERRLVRFNGPVSDSQRESLRNAGVLLMAYLGEDSYFASIDPRELDVAAALEAARIIDVRVIAREMKMSPALLRGTLPPWAILTNGKAEAQRSARPLPEGDEGVPDPLVAVYVLFHRDADLDDEASEAVRRSLGQVRSYLNTINGMVVELPLSRLKALADEPSVQYLEPPLPPWRELNEDNRLRTGAEVAQAAPYSLTGLGVTVLIYDSGQVLTSHIDFGGRAIVGSGDTAPVADHSTHVAGTVGGDGAASGGLHRGMAPGVNIVSYGFESDGSADFLYLDPGDLESDYSAAVITHGAALANNSIGTNTAANGFPCSWEGDYGVTDVLIDSIVRGSLGSPFRVVWANGNERGNGRCGTTYHTSAPPACAKNHLTVGAINSDTDTMTDFSSWGPADDGRLKPDVVAPGDQLSVDFGVTSCSSASTTAYAIKQGTSMAAPTVTGCAALLMQDYRLLHPGAPDFRNSMLRAVFAHTAVDLGAPGPDYQFGYGSIRVVPAIEAVRAGNLLEDQVVQGSSKGLVIVVAPGTPQLKITMAWDDAPGTPNVSPALVNDLDLVVFSPGGARAFPWTLGGLADPASPAVRVAENHVDNIEQVVVENPDPGVWVVEVRGTTVPEGPQPFSIISSSTLVNCSDAGVIALDRSFYPCGAAVEARVIDCGLNTSDSTIETVQINLKSSSNPAGIPVTLTEIAPEAADFRATVLLSAGGGGGTLAASHGDTITATYVDADTGGGSGATVTAQATVDCQPPVISNLSISAVNAVTGLVTFATDEPARSTVRYGVSCGSPSASVSSAGLQPAHSFQLSSLSPSTQYRVSVEATDEAGNLATDDNAGSCHLLTTPTAIDYLSENFDGNDNDLAMHSITFTPSGGPAGYEVCSLPIVLLPSDPTGGTTLNMGDDGPGKLITLGGGQMIQLFGVSYGSFYVNPNGNITFGSEDRDAGETLTDHFSRPRISALFDDLDPASGGTVSWKQLADRVVITYLSVPQYSLVDSNSFQYELFFDGRIRLNYLALGATDGLAGLSRGTGLQPDFFESDLSASPSCGPQPPSALGASAQVASQHSVLVPLPAIDDGLPVPPGALERVIKSLPAHGSLVDVGVGGGLISTVPYTLASGGSTVRYAPIGVFQGNDAFTYLVRDGGVPPSGGESNIAAANVSVGVPVPVYSFLVDDTNPGWFLGPAGEWSFGPPTGQGGAASGGIGNPDPTSGYTGANVLGYNLDGNYTNNLVPLRNLVSNPINCSNLTKTSVQFRRWLGVESSTYDHATFQVANSLAAWTTLWQNPTISMNPTSWTLVEYDISAVADGKPNVYLRWTMGTTDSSAVFCGWNIDDIVVKGLAPLAACPGDANGDRHVNFSDVTSVLANFGSVGAAQAEGDANADTTVNFADITGVLGNWGAVCP